MRQSQIIRLRALGFHILEATAIIIVISLMTACLVGLIAHQGVATLQSWSATAIHGEWLVTSVDPLGPAAKAGLDGNDKVISVNGRTDPISLGPGLEISQKLRSQYLLLLRNGTPLQLKIPIWRDSQFSVLYASYFFFALFNLVLALILLRTHLKDVSAQLAFILFLCASIVFLNADLTLFPPPFSPRWLSILKLFGSLAWRPLQWATLFDLSIRFPKTEMRWSGLMTIKRVLYLSGAMISGCLLLPEVLLALNQTNFHSPWMNNLLLLFVSEWRVTSLETFSATTLLLTLLVFGIKYVRISDKTLRARLRWIAFGVSLALIPIGIQACVLLFLHMLSRADLVESINGFLDPIVVLFSALIPITFTYAIVKHQIMGIRLTIRRGVQYLLAQNVLRAICYLPLTGMVAELFFERRKPLQEIVLGGSWWTYFILFFSLCLTFYFRKRIEQWVDRKFFRAAYEEEVIMPELIASIQACGSLDEVASCVATRLENIFRSEGSAFLTRSENKQWSTLFEHETSYPLSLDPEAIQFANRVFVCSVLANANGDHPETRQQLIGTQIFNPDGEAIAILVLGPRKSEEAYSQRDKKLLEAVAAQIGLILQVLALETQAREYKQVQVNVLSRLDKNAIDLVAECPKCNRCYKSGIYKSCPADGYVLALTLPVESVIDGKYRLQRRIGTGGMSAVYEATDLRLQRTVAVKVLTGRLFGNSGAVRRFEREARAVARLQHANIVPIYDCGQLRGDGAFLIMKLIEGHSWRSELTHHDVIDPERVASWFDQLCAAMIFAHSSGIVHRDLKPENLMISNGQESNSDHLTVLDFGLAKGLSYDGVAESLTAEATVLGTLGYMSPEQRLGVPVDSRSDVYSSAVLLAETLSGSRPTLQGASQDWLQRVLSWNEQASLVTEQLTDLLSRCLAENPDERVASMRHLRTEMVPLLQICPAIPRLRKMATAASLTAAVTLPIQF